MKKRIILLILSAIMAILLVGCSSSENSEHPTNTETEGTKVEEERKENEIEILSYSYDSGVAMAILLDTKENILYGLVKITWNNAGSEPGEFFMLVDPEGNPYVYDSEADSLPELILQQKEESEHNLMTYIFSDSIYHVRYVLLFTYNNNAGAYTGNVVTLLDAEGNPSTY